MGLSARHGTATSIKVSVGFISENSAEPDRYPIADLSGDIDLSQIKHYQRICFCRYAPRKWRYHVLGQAECPNAENKLLVI